MESFDENHIGVGLSWPSFTTVLIQEFVDVGFNQAIPNLNVAYNQHLARSMKNAFWVDFVDEPYLWFGKNTLLQFNEKIFQLFTLFI